jgi:hypothetical protein
MTIKKSIVGSLFSMLLVSEMAAADWGDVYYCQMTNFIQVEPNGERTNYKLEKFQFKLDQTKNAMVFGSNGYFGDTADELSEGMSWPNSEEWYSNSKYSVTYFDNGRFLFTHNGSAGISAISADCNKF